MKGLGRQYTVVRGHLSGVDRASVVKEDRTAALVQCGVSVLAEEQ